MATFTYEVIVIREGQTSNYNKYWKENTKNSNEQYVDTSLLSFTEFIEAKNKTEAIKEAQRKHPRCEIDYEATVKLG